MATRQSGITLIGFLIMLVVVGFFAFMAMKLFPAYSEFFGVSKALTQVATEGVDGKDIAAIRRDFDFKLSMQYVDDATVKPRDITVGQGPHGQELRVSYDKDVPFLYNIDFLIHFNKAVPVSGNLASSI